MVLPPEFIDQDPFILNERRIERATSDLNHPNPSRTSSSRPLLQSNYLRRDSFEFAVDDDGSEKTTFTMRNLTRVSWGSLGSAASSALLMPKSTRRGGFDERSACS